MSKVLWSNAVVPRPNDVFRTSLHEYFPGLDAENLRRLPIAADDLVELPDRRAARTMSRAGLLLCAAALPARNEFKEHQARAMFRVGLYGAVHHGPEPYEHASALPEVDEAFASQYKKLVLPTAYLKVLPNLAVAHVGIFLGMVGPTSVFVHPRIGSLHALLQAEDDLEFGIIDAALVCAASSLFDDPLSLASARVTTSREIAIGEGASALILVPTGAPVRWADKMEAVSQVDPGVDYGIADFLIKFVQKEQSHDG